MLRTAIAAARRVKQARLAGKPVPDFTPACFVRSVQEKAYVVTFEVAFVSPAEVEKLTGCAPNQCGMGKPSTLVLEDGQTSLKGWFLSLKGLKSEESACLRKVRLERCARVELAEDLMQPKNQLRPDQQTDVFDFVSAAQTKASPLNLNQRQHIAQIEDIRQKAQAAEQAGFVLLGSALLASSDRRKSLVEGTVVSVILAQQAR